MLASLVIVYHYYLTKSNTNCLISEWTERQRFESKPNGFLILTSQLMDLLSRLSSALNRFRTPQDDPGRCPECIFMSYKYLCFVLSMNSLLVLFRHCCYQAWSFENGLETSLGKGRLENWHIRRNVSKSILLISIKF